MAQNLPPDLSDKAIKLAMSAHDVGVLTEIIDILETQVGFFRKRLQDTKDILQTQHDDLLNTTTTVTTTQPTAVNTKAAKSGG